VLTLLSAAGLGGGGLCGGILPLNEPIDDEPDCSASLLRRASIVELPAFLTNAELSAPASCASTLDDTAPRSASVALFDVVVATAAGAVVSWRLAMLSGS